MRSVALYEGVEDKIECTLLGLKTENSSDLARIGIDDDDDHYYYTLHLDDSYVQKPRVSMMSRD